MTIHHHFTRGKRVRCFLKNGEVFDDKFIRRARDGIVFEERGRVKFVDMRSTTIARGEKLKGET